MQACVVTIDNPRDPVVMMTKEEAVALSIAIQNARKRIVSKIAEVGRMRNLSDDGKRSACAPLRAELATLEAFQAAHDEAHELGGY